jgi:hypothetical protein
MVAVARNVYVAYDAAERSAALDRLRRQHAHMIALSQHAARPVASHILAYADGDGAPEAAALYGPPDMIARELAALRAAGAAYILVNGGGTARDNLRRFAREVMPAFVA